MSNSGQTELENEFIREALLNDIRQRPRSLRPTPPRFPNTPSPLPSRSQIYSLGNFAREKPRLPPTLRNPQQGIQNSAETRLDIAESFNEIRLGPPPPPPPYRSQRYRPPVRRVDRYLPPPPHVPRTNVAAEISEPSSNEQQTENFAIETNSDFSPDKKSAHKSSRCILL